MAIKVFGLTFLKGRLQTNADELFVVDAVIPGIAAADAFDANDAVGDVFAVDVPTAGWITGARLIDADDDTLALTAHIYTVRFVGAASDAAYTVGAEFSRYWVTNITFDLAEDEGGFKVAEEVGNSFYRSPSGKLWIQCSTTGTPNIALTAMPRLQLGIKVAAGG